MFTGALKSGDTYRTKQSNILEDRSYCFVKRSTLPSLAESLPPLSPPKKYEAKRQQYLAAKGGRTSDEPQVRFQESQHTQGAPAASGHPPLVTGAPFRGGARHDATQPQSYEQRGQPNELPIHTDNDRTGGVHEPSERRDPTGGQSPRQRRPLEQDILLRQQTPATVVSKHPNADYARQLQDQIMADMAGARRAKEIERHPTAPSSTTTTTPANGQNVLHTSEAATRSTEDMASLAITRKAEYARQLREQMAADQAMKYALETERKRSAAPIASGAVPASEGDEERARGSGIDRAGGPVRNSKAEYAQQLRDQMEAKENAQRAVKGRGEHSPSSLAGPSWIEGATEGREARRRQSNAEYAEQLRAQIAAQRSINQAEQSRIVSRLEPAKDWYHQARRGHDQEQQQWPGGTEFEEERRRPERQPTSTSSQSVAQNSLALERQGNRIY